MIVDRYIKERGDIEKEIERERIIIIKRGLRENLVLFFLFFDEEVEI